MPSFGEYSEVAICNMALAQVGRGAQIVSLDEASQAARACRLRYPYARDAALRAYDWNFAARRAALARNAAPPAFDFANAYDLPADCLMVREVFGADATRWIVEGRQILTDLGDPIFVSYTGLVSDTSAFDPLFADALAARIAADIAVQLSENVGRAQGLWQIYLAKLIEARRRDAQEGRREVFGLPGWSGMRLD